MIHILQSRRTFLSQVLLSLPTFSILSACESNPNDTQKMVNALTRLIHHIGVAAHLGRLNSELNPDLQTLSLEQLIADIIVDTGLDETVFSLEDKSIRAHLDQKIRHDFSVENVVKIDGWLLSRTQATICTLLYRSHQ